MTTLNTTASIIDALGGNPAVAKLLDTTVRAVWNWRANDRFPAHSYLVIRAALARRKLTAPDHLWSMTQKARRRKTANA